MKRILSIFAAGLLLMTACSEKPVEPARVLEEFSVKPADVTVTAGDQFKLKVTATPVYEDIVFTFASSKESVAAVDDKGTVTAVAEGEAVITVSNNIDKKTAECKVKVEKLVVLESITLEPAELKLEIGKTVALTMTPNPVMPDLEFTWASSNNDVCTVDQEGNVTGIAEGEATVTVTNALYDKSASTKVNVSIRLFSGGKGTSSDPYQISEPADLDLLAEYSLGGEAVAKYSFESASYIVTKDIEYNPLGEAGDTVKVLATAWATTEKPFKGTFDGNNKKISGFYMGSDFLVSLDKEYTHPFKDNNEIVNYATGLIGFAEGATVKNVVLENVHIQSFGVNVGGIVGFARANTVISNCKVLGGVPTDCYDNGALVGDGNVSIKTKTGSYVYGKGKWIDAADPTAPFGEDGYKFSYGLVGGIAGQVKDSKIENCSVNAYVRCIQRNGGGIAGIIIGNSQVTGCTVEGIVYSGMTNSGGLVGTMFGENTVVDGCTIKNVCSQKYSFAGCVTGVCCDGGTIRNCVVDGAYVSLFNPSAAANFVAGIVGYIKLKPVLVENCKIVNTTVSATGYGIAGVCGRPDASITVKNVYVGNCNLEGLKTYEKWSTYVGKDAKGGYWVGGIFGQVNPAAGTANHKVVVDNCLVETDIKASYGAGGIFANSTTNANGNTPITISNVGYKGKLITWSMNSYNHAMAGGIAANPNSTTKGTVCHIANCYARPEIELSSVATAGSTAGLLGYSQNNMQCLIGYSDITRAKIIKITEGVGAAIPDDQARHGGILGVTNTNEAASNGDQFLYKNLYWSDQIQFGVSNKGAFDTVECEALTAAQFTDGTLLSKLNAAVAAYNADSAKKATASEWVAGEGGFPTIKGLPSAK